MMPRTLWRLSGALLALTLAFAAGWLCRPAPPAKDEPAVPAARGRAAGGRGGDGGGQSPAGEAPAGKWRSARHEATQRLPEDRARLLVAPYLQGYRPAGDEPVISRYNPQLAFHGFNLVTSGHAPEALLTDMEGRILHRWRQDLRRLWPDLYAGEQESIRKLEYWRRVRLLEDGSLLAIFEGLGLIRLDRASRLQWAYRGGAHHDLEVDAAGNVWVLDREGRVLPRIHPQKGVLEDFITQLDPQGKVVRKISLLECFERSAYAPLLHRMPAAGDIFHTNTLELLDGRFERLHPAFRAGNFLVSVLELDTIAVIDPQRAEVLWALTGMWRKQHQPTFLDTGHLLLFDNLGAGAGQSRILELDPLSQQIRWHYGGRPEDDFFSRTLGTSQRLPNGNTLITESENGRAFEVTAGGEVVWEYFNPHRAGDRGELIAVLFEVLRLPPDHGFVAAVTAGCCTAR